MIKNFLEPFKHRSYFKLQALGNSYVVIDSDEWAESELHFSWIEQLCSKEWGVGSDGVLWGPGGKSFSSQDKARLRIFNSDGSEAEKSGNGLRIFARYLRDCRQFPSHFNIKTLGGEVGLRDLGEGGIEVKMGRGRLLSSRLPENFQFSGRLFAGLRVDVGNPHCVLFDPLPWDEMGVKEWGPKIEKDALFPNRSNVQWVRVKDRQTIEILIWERGSGYTLASGSSSCAAAFAAFKLGLVDRALRVVMPGGRIHIEIDSDDEITMLGEVQWIAQGQLR